MSDFGIFDPRLVQRVKEEWERTKGEVRKATAPILDEAGHIFEGVFGAHTTRPTTPLDGYEWQQVPGEEEALRARLERTVSDLTMVERQTVTLDDPGTATASFVVRVVLTDGTTWQARVPVAVVAGANEAELRLWALRLAGKVRE